MIGVCRSSNGGHNGVGDCLGQWNFNPRSLNQVGGSRGKHVPGGFRDQKDLAMVRSRPGDPMWAVGLFFLGQLTATPHWRLVGLERIGNGDDISGE